MRGGAKGGAGLERSAHGTVVIAVRDGDVTFGGGVLLVKLYGA